MYSMNSPRHMPAALLLLFALLSASCGGGAAADSTTPVALPGGGAGLPPPGGGGGNPTPGGGGGGGGGGGVLLGGVLVTLVDSGEQFQIWVTEPVAAQTLVDIWNGAVAFTNITGPIRAGSGQAQHNAPWSWHLDPAQVLVNIQTFAPVYSERPSVVEANLATLLAAGQDKMTGNGNGTLSNVQDFR